MKYNWYANTRYKNSIKCSIKIRGGKKKVGGEKKEQVQWMTSNYKVAINTTIAVITLNVNGLNKKVKNRDVRVDKPRILNYMLSARNPLQIKSINRLKVNGSRYTMLTLIQRNIDSLY